MSSNITYPYPFTPPLSDPFRKVLKSGALSVFPGHEEVGTSFASIKLRKALARSSTVNVFALRSDANKSRRTATKMILESFTFVPGWKE
jgi:hypothetical protein